MGWRHNAGLLFIISVLVTWVTSAEITQGIFEGYEHPFAMAYLGTSILVFYLPIAVTKNWLYRFLTSYKDSKADVLYSAIELEDKVGGCIDGKGNGWEGKEASESGLLCDDDTLKHDNKLTGKEIAALGFFLSPLWFISEYSTNSALARTSVARTTLLSSTSGLFTLFIGAFLGQGSIDTTKVVSVAVSMGGVAMTTLGKTWSSDGSQLNKSINAKHSLAGDLFAILSALTDALFTVLLKKFTGEEGERVDMQKLYGYIGLFSLILLWWIIWPLTAMGLEPKFTVPHSSELAGILIANCFVASFLCDYFWALGVVWTTPLVAALGVSLTIPLTMLADMAVHGQHYSPIYMIGSALVLLGFVVANFPDNLSGKLKFQIKKYLS